MKKILSLWSTPRSRSTAFMWMIKNRGDFTVLYHPFGKSAYYSEERIFHSASDVKPNPEYNYDIVLQNLVSTFEKEPVFVKDFPFYFLHRVDDRFLSLFQHTFLIRHPANMLPSYFDKYPELTIEEVGYQQLLQLFEKVVQFTVVVPPIVDADDLVKHPKATVRAYCESVGIPFIPEALSWEPPKDKIEAMSWWGRGSWHETVSMSSGFNEQSNPHYYLNINESERLKYFYDLCLPYYEKLYAHRLRIF
jgi:hypothetical protein